MVNSPTSSTMLTQVYAIKSDLPEQGSNSQNSWGWGWGKDLHDHLMSTRRFTLILNKKLIRSLRMKWLQPQFAYVNHLVLIACFTS